MVFFLFNEAIPSLLITAGEVMGEEEDPQRLFNEVFLLVSLLPALLGSPRREPGLLKPPAPPGGAGGGAKKCGQGGN